MSGSFKPILAAAIALGAAVAAASASGDTPTGAVSIDQKVALATLAQYHHTDQGTRIMPAAFLAALMTADGSEKLMSPDSMRKFGFIIEAGGAGKLNPYGWPLGWTVSDPKVSQGIAVAGVTCALCHTGEVDYKGAAVRIEGGQSDIDLPAFQAAVFSAIGATANDPARRAKFLKGAVAAGYPADRVGADFDKAVKTAGELLYGQKGLTGAKPGPGRVDAVQGIANAVFATALQVPGNARDFDAPVNYPYLWDIWRLSWLQYNGFLPPQSTSRNIAETLGTSGKMNLVDPATGALNSEPQRGQTSVQLNNLIWIESVVKQVKAPTWPAKVLGPIDQAKAAHGRELFVQNCAGCHGIKELPNGLWDVSIVSLDKIGTDPNQATDWAGRTYDASKLGLGPSVTAVALGGAINAIRKELYRENNIPASKQEGDVSFEAACGYKARPLIGVWATPPFLHNGSVRTVFDLLSETRPASFTYGSREYDPVRLGYSEDGGINTTVFDSTVTGNSDAGHWWTDDLTRPGRIGPKLSDDDKYAIIEYLKAATYDNYPKEKRATEAPLPCGGDPSWATAK